MQDISIEILLGILVFLIVLSGFFSSSETALMALNRYRLRHLAQNNHRGAVRAQKLLQTPDRLIGLILLGNNFVNILASAIATLLAVHFWGDQGVAIATIGLTVIILIFAEVTPKTMAALKPERIAFPASFILGPMMRISYPFVWVINQVTRFILAIFGVRDFAGLNEQLSAAELRTAVVESGKLGSRHQNMLVNLLDLGETKVEEIMIPRSEVVGLDLEEDWDITIKRMTGAYFTRFPVYFGDINDIQGILHMRVAVQSMAQNKLTPEKLQAMLRKPYFIPIGTTLSRQLLEFQKRKRRLALVVDEYGDVQGMVTLDDILEEIVGEYTSEPASKVRKIQKRKEGEFVVDGQASLRSLNRRMGWDLPADEARTINGLILEHLETIPRPETSIRIKDLGLTIIKIKNNQIKTVKIETLAKPNKEDSEEPDEHEN